MCSDRKLLANRNNAQKSTGPRTIEGKARSRLNALTHGLTASSPTLLPTEDPQFYTLFCQELLNDLNPQSALQLTLAHRIVQLSWRLQRLAAAESELFLQINRTRREGMERYNAATQKMYKKHRLKDAPEPEPLPPELSAPQILAQAFSDEDQANPFVRLQKYEATLSRQLSRLLGDYRQRQQQDQQIEATEEIDPTEQIEATDPQPQQPAAPNGQIEATDPLRASVPSCLRASDLQIEATEAPAPAPLTNDESRTTNCPNKPTAPTTPHAPLPAGTIT